MSLPQAIRVKLSSEAAEAISITPVVVRDMPLRELIEYMLGITGKDEARVQECLARGTLVSGASRFRWNGWQADAQGLRDLLATFPDADPARPFAAARCTRAVLRGGRQLIEIPREAGRKKSLFRRASFWDLLLEVALAGTLRYADYSYKERADCYQVEFAFAAAERLRASAGMLRYATLRQQVESVAFTGADFFVERA